MAKMMAVERIAMTKRRFRHCMSRSAARSMYATFFLNAPSTTEIYSLSLHDALPIARTFQIAQPFTGLTVQENIAVGTHLARARSEEHTSELQSLTNLVCRLLLD